jgi:hypothetical protein
MYKAMFTGSSINPRLMLESQSTDLDWIISIAKMVMPNISPAYNWCGIFDSNNKLVKEFSFNKELVIK